MRLPLSFSALASPTQLVRWPMRCAWVGSDSVPHPALVPGDLLRCQPVLEGGWAFPSPCRMPPSLFSETSGHVMSV
eukprot:6016939-Pyramimonas_sp.AAC.1